MPSLISSVWDHSTCQVRVESDKIQNEDVHSGIPTHSPEICSPMPCRLRYADLIEKCII